MTAAEPTSGFSRLLTGYLLGKHDKYAPPDYRVNITIGIDLVQILNVNEVTQQMTVQVFIHEEWMDKTLTWDPSQFGGLKHTWIPEDEIWISDITVLNTMEFMNIMDSVRTPAEISHTGKVVRSYPALYAISCDISIEDFPLDNQQCELVIASWGYAKDKLVIRFGNQSLVHYRKNEEWALNKVFTDERIYDLDGNLHSEARFIIAISRKPLYYVVNLVFPCYIICILGIAGLFARFSTRPERQERYTLGVTALVSVAVFGTVVAEKIPHTSREIPSLLIFFLYDLVLLSIATMAAGVVMWLNYKGNKPNAKMPPAWLPKLFLCAKWDKRHHRDILDLVDDPMESSFHHGNVSKLMIMETWAVITHRIDSFLFFLFFLFITIPTVDMIKRCADKLDEPDVNFVESY
uniref:Neur_chan_LBD domain-containing protein n=1 Tax=Panagrellus redivivus TaxID=6233 RepID=A0A7E4ZXA0_PANRE